MGRKYEMTWWERLYYPELIRGALITGRHFFVNLIGFLPVVGKLVKSEVQTYQWPEEIRPISDRWRGKHRLNKREDGTVRCVACMCCATVCPSECIYIEADEDTERNGIEKYPMRFEIDLFRCVYCGMCVEACPCNAILMDTQEMRFCEYSPDEFVVNKKDLLNW